MGGHQGVGRRAALHPVDQRVQPVPGVGPHAAAAVVHPRGHEEARPLAGSGDVPAERGVDHVAVVGHGRLRDHEGIRPAVVQDELPVLLQEEARQVGVDRVGDSSHHVALAVRHVVDVELPPRPLRGCRRPVGRRRGVEQIRGRHAGVDVVEQVVQVVAAEPYRSRRESIAGVWNEQPRPLPFGSERLAGVDRLSVAVARPGVEVPDGADLSLREARLPIFAGRAAVGREVALGVEAAGERVVDHAVRDAVVPVARGYDRVGQQLELADAVQPSVAVGIGGESAAEVVAEHTL